MSPRLRTPLSALLRRSAALAAAALLAACGTSAPPTTLPTAPATAPPTAPSPSATPVATPGASPRPAVAAGEPWIVFQSLADQFDPLADQDGVDHDDTIFLARPDGSGLHRLAPEDFEGSEIRPTWSPDGAQIAFIRARFPDDRGELWVINADGSGAELVYRCVGPLAPQSDCNSIGDPDWASDGDLYFSRDSDVPVDGPPQTFEIWRHSFETGTAGPVLTRHDRTVEQARISPDASEAVYVSFRNIESEAPDAALFVADLASGDERRITDWTLFPADPDWSVRGLIAFNSHDLRLYPEMSNPSDIYTVRPDGSGQSRLTRFNFGSMRATQPRWTSDGASIVFTRVTPDPNDPYGVRQIWTMGADGANRSEIVGGLIGTHPEPRP